MLDVALLSSRPNFPFLLLNCTEVVPNKLQSYAGSGVIRAWAKIVWRVASLIFCLNS